MDATGKEFASLHRALSSGNNTVVVSPCAACKILRTKCVENCVFAPYFPPSELLKFVTAHRVFGASNIIKLILELPEGQRADAVSSMVYEANARIRDPVYGCAGAMCYLQKEVNELHLQLAMAQAEIVHLQCQNSNLTLLYMNLVQSQEKLLGKSSDSDDNSDKILDSGSFLDTNTGYMWWET